jgi:molybdenum cofactor cytidylyltransferase
MNRYGIIILAAGSSSRLGRPKQTVKMGQETLLQRAIRVASGSMNGPVITVLGSGMEEIIPTLDKARIFIAVNSEWGEGIASSIRAGLQELIKQQPETDAAIIMVCDQPFADTLVLKTLISTFEQTNKPVVASSYAGSIGTPVLFHRSVFDRLEQLKGDSGAKKILTQYPGLVETIPFEKGSIDIDLESDLDKLRV